MSLDETGVAFYSEWAAYKNFKSGTAIVTPETPTTANATTIWSSDIPHDAGRPVPFILYLENPFDWGMTPSTALMSFNIGLDAVNFVGIMTNTELRISVVHSDTSGLVGVPSGTSYTFKYFIFYD